MKGITYCCLIFASLSFLGSGCTTKTKARLHAQQAFNAGQQQAMVQLQQPSGDQIQVTGDVQYPHLTWSDGLTVAQAIVAAGYRGIREPQEIFIYRRGEAIAINPKALLRGEDVLLEPGDRIILR
ncbi:MAG: hypothetical protein H0X66_10755 [Verrucomicrobia bacterium]|nr:hypothetical protein [Verrucomicrobiota bacterium]